MKMTLPPTGPSEDTLILQTRSHMIISNFCIPPPCGQLFLIFLVVSLTPDNEHMYSKTDFAQEKGNFHLTTRISRPLRMIICKRPVPPNDHLQGAEGHEKNIFEALHNEIK